MEQRNKVDTEPDVELRDNRGSAPEPEVKPQAETGNESGITEPRH